MPLLGIIFESLLPCFISWQVWKARNAFRFHSRFFSIDAIIFQVDSDLKLASSTFGFKPSQLKEVFGSQIVEALRVMAPTRRLIRLVSWIRPPPGVVKLTVDGFSTGNPGMAALGGILQDHRGMFLAAFRSFLNH